MALPAKDAPVLLRLDGITKRFGALTANDGVYLDLRQGEILALLGENGAGKTTLMNILFGHYVADEGSVLVSRDGGELAQLEPGSPHAALDAGIGMVHQHFTLAENLSVLDNILLGTEKLSALKSARAPARRKLADLMTRSGLTVGLDMRVSQLSVGEKQRVEILKALYRNARVLVLDEPTAVLTPQESDTLFAILKKLAAAGLGIVFISHKLAEVMAASHRIAVLRGGAKVADLPTSQCDQRQLAELMVGHEVSETVRGAGAPGDTLFVLTGVSAGESRESIRDVNLELRSGEILGIAGVSGNGQTMLARVISGLETPVAGSMRLGDRALTHANARTMIDAGLARIPEDRHRDGIVGAMTVSENLAIEAIRKPESQRFGLLRFAAMRDKAKAMIDAYDIRCQGEDSPARLLSGGNIQKIVLARTLEGEPKVVLAAQPSRGLDVGATSEVYRRLLDARARGAGVLLISEDLDELMRLSDRIAVIHRGHLSAAEPTETLDRGTLGLRMAGHTMEAAE
ncbi:ABC transporter ATP-binding protein [Roseibium marinum]|uniref:Simple sugar transport system ATP-binding protein n=1 Tax=Roseibium marinum TaxID=281252 RepID=A0A2S3V0W9_9HYPH|nr:ABC transporter ATP-binding protein [Roseibium marinum]POF33622.1 simple sugar transport system ATP-binding protein [Roseibium marinum]